MDFLDKLDFLMHRDGLNRNTLSQKSGVPYSTIDALYKKGYQNIKMGTVRNLARAFSVTLDELMAETDDDDDVTPVYGSRASVPKRHSAQGQRLAAIYDSLDAHGQQLLTLIADAEEARMKQPAPESDTIPLMLAEDKVSAGRGIYLSPERFTILQVSAKDIPPQTDYAVQVKGNSMEPKYRDGDILLVNKTPADIGSVGIYTIEGCGYVKKRGYYSLKSINADYPDIPLTEETVQNGTVIGVYRG